MALYDLNSLSTAIGAAAALGTACFGIVEGLKWTPLGEAGFAQLKAFLGEGLLRALAVAYGPGYEALLRAQYRQDWARSPLAKTLRQGVRIGLTPENAAAIAHFLGSISPEALLQVAQKLKSCETPLGDQDRATIGRMELAADVRIDAALARAQDLYLGTVRLLAAVVAVVLAELAAALGSTPGQFLADGWLKGLLVGTLAVPLAPIANDLVSALQAATKALRGR